MSFLSPPAAPKIRQWTRSERLAGRRPPTVDTGLCRRLVPESLTVQSEVTGRGVPQGRRRLLGLPPEPYPAVVCLGADELFGARESLLPRLFTMCNTHTRLREREDTSVGCLLRPAGWTWPPPSIPELEAAALLRSAPEAPSGP